MEPVTSIYGALPAITGTLITAILAIVIAWPIGFGIAFFLTEICPARAARPLGIAIELLAAIPSIVYGMWGFFVLAPFMAENVQPWLTEVFAVDPAAGRLVLLVLRPAARRRPAHRLARPRRDDPALHRRHRRATCCSRPRNC